MTPKLSIVIPCYNGELFIKRCLDKALAIDLNKEIIVINDGSTDESLKLLREYGKSIILINLNKNLGVSHARNLGIKAAHGKYLAFIDIDDDFELCIYNRMIDNLEKHSSDICICDNDTILENNAKIRRHYKIQITTLLQEEVIRLFLTDQICPAVWSSLYKTDIVKQIKFNESLSIGEDFLFPLQLYLRLNKISFLNEPLYHYVLQKNSSMHKLSDKLLQYSLVPKFLDERETNLLKEKFFDEFNYFILKMKIRSVYAISLLSKSNKEKAKELIKQIEISKNDISAIIHSKYSTKFEKMEFFIFKHFGISFHLFMFPIYIFLKNVFRRKKQ